MLKNASKRFCHQSLSRDSLTIGQQNRHSHRNKESGSKIVPPGTKTFAKVFKIKAFLSNVSKEVRTVHNQQCASALLPGGGGQLSYWERRHDWLKSMRSSSLPPWLVSVELTDPPAEEGVELIPLSLFIALAWAECNALDCS